MFEFYHSYNQRLGIINRRAIVKTWTWQNKKNLKMILLSTKHSELQITRKQQSQWKRWYFRASEFEITKALKKQKATTERLEGLKLLTGIYVQSFPVFILKCYLFQAYWKFPLIWVCVEHSKLDHQENKKLKLHRLLIWTWTTIRVSS